METSSNSSYSLIPLCVDIQVICAKSMCYQRELRSSWTGKDKSPPSHSSCRPLPVKSPAPLKGIEVGVIKRLAWDMMSRYGYQLLKGKMQNSELPDNHSRIQENNIPGEIFKNLT